MLFVMTKTHAVMSAVNANNISISSIQQHAQHSKYNHMRDSNAERKTLV